MTVTMPEQQPEQTSDLARFTAMVAAYAAAQEALRVNLMALILRYWRLVTNPFAPDQVTQYGEGVAVAVRAAQKRSMDLSVAHQRALLGDMDVKLPRFAMDLPEQPRGVDPVEVAQRALREARILESAGDRTALNPVPLSRAEAMDRGLQRALRMANDDVDLAAREVPSRLSPVFPTWSSGIAASSTGAFQGRYLRLVRSGGRSHVHGGRTAADPLGLQLLGLADHPRPGSGR